MRSVLISNILLRKKLSKENLKDLQEFFIWSLHQPDSMLEWISRDFSLPTMTNSDAMDPIAINGSFLNRYKT